MDKVARLQQKLDRMGCSYLEYAEMSKAAKGLPKNRRPVDAFHIQKHNAKVRGIEWKLTLGEWWRVWRDSGKWELRGKDSGRYVMARVGDIGAYELGNVYIVTSRENISIAKHKIYDLPMGVSHSDNRKKYRARVNWADQHIALGTFDTPEEAHKEYVKFIKHLDEYKLILDTSH